MFLTTLFDDKIINSERIQEVRLTDEEYPPTGWNDEGVFFGAYFIVIDVLNSKRKMETVFYEEFPILDAEFVDYEYPNLMFGTKQDYLNGLALKEAQEEMRKLCRKLNRKTVKKKNKKQVA